MNEETNLVYQPEPEPQAEQPERRSSMTKETMQKILKGIDNDASECALTGREGGPLLFIETYNKLRKTALENDWIDGDIVVELDLNNEAIFGVKNKKKHNMEIMGVISSATALFRACLEE